jgi:hypothetical protein
MAAFAKSDLQPRMLRAAVRRTSLKKTEMKEIWQLVEQHGCWWAYKGETPPPAAFQTHRRNPNRRSWGRILLA